MRAYGNGRDGRIYREVQQPYVAKPRTKVCCRCRLELPVEEFNRKGADPHGQSHCRACGAAYKPKKEEA